MLSKLEVLNFKSLSHTEINFGKLTILAGSNSVGKSSIIQSILLSRISIEKLSQFNLLDSSNTHVDKIVQVPLNGKYMMALGNTKEVLTRDSDNNFIQFTLFDEDRGGLKLIFQAEDVKDYVFDLDLIKYAPFGNFEILQNEFYYLNAERIGPRLNYEVDQFDFVNVGCQGEYAIQVLSMRKEYDIEGGERRRFTGSQDSKLINQVRAWMDFIIPGFYLDDAILHGKLKKAETTFSNSAPTNVGFGISYVLPIVVNGLVAKEGNLFIIENPEAHLHPKGQSNIGYFLAKMAASGLQILIETHSEHVINGIRVASLENDAVSTNDTLIHFFQKDENNVTSFKEIRITEDGDLTDFPEDFFDQTQQDLLKIYTLSRSKNNG